jgi:hypothetical protein
MRLRRTILLGLGPLLGLWTMNAAFAASPIAQGRSEQAAAASLHTLFAPVVSLLMLAAETPNKAVRATTSLQAVLGFDALHETPLRGSIHLVRSRAVFDPASRADRHAQLRC